MSVPVGVERVRFHAYRVFHPMTIVNEVAPDLILQEFSYVDLPNYRIETCVKDGDVVTGPDLRGQDSVAGYRQVLDSVTKNELGCWRTGLFTFKKV